MRKWIWFLLFMCVAFLFIMATPEIEEGQRIVWTELFDLLSRIILLILGIYEVLARLFPTVSDVTIIGNIIKALKWISDILNNRNDKKTIKLKIEGKSFVTTKSE